MHLAFSNKILIPHIDHKELEGGIHVYQLFMPRLVIDKPGMKGRYYNKLLKKLRKHDFEPALIHGNVFYPAGEMSTYMKTKLNVPLVFTEHWTIYREDKKHEFTPVIQQSIAKAVKETDAIMPVSRELVGCMKSHGLDGNYQVVNNAVDTKLFYPVVKPDRERTVFLHVSNFHILAKNTEGILTAFSRAQLQNAELVIAGDGDFKRLRKHCKEHELDLSNVRFVGPLDYHEVAAIMQESDVFVLFSNFENLPCVITEAHCCGLPVITTAVGGIPEMMNEGNGIMVNRENIDQLVEAFKTMNANFSSYNKTQIAEEAQARYSYESIGAQFDKVYLRVLKN
jgi:glycosyltransferase involved in cell wall biosynthesis